MQGRWVRWKIWGDGMAGRLRSIAMTVLGIVLSLIPPALWVAWSETVLIRRCSHWYGYRGDADYRGRLDRE